MVEEEKDNNKKLNIEERYNLLKEDYTKRNRVTVITFILLGLFFISVIPILSTEIIKKYININSEGW